MSTTSYKIVSKSPVSVEVHVIAEMKIFGTSAMERKDAFIPTKKLYGGILAVKLYLKKVVIDSVDAWEASATEIQHIF